MMTTWTVFSLALLTARATAKPSPVDYAAGTIAPVPLLKTIREISADDFEGRAPGTRAEEKTVAYLTRRLKDLGAEPGNPDGTFVQAVPLVGFTSRPSVAFHAVDQTLSPSFPNEFVAVSRRASTETVLAGSELVFVGYGIQAPEYRWDDYKGLDVRGKTLVMLVNDPPIQDPNDPLELDPKMFKGRAMTYYGRWTYKYEIAKKLGAAAVFIVHETEPAGYPYEVVSGSFGREQFDIRGGSTSHVDVEGWISSATAQALFALAGKDYFRSKVAANDASFKPVPLGVTLEARVRNEVRLVDSKNVVGRIAGSDPKLQDEWVIYTAHWDHLGKDDSLAGDTIYNGAIDNGSGVAAELEIASAFKRLPAPPARSILFLFPTAEEKGLLGSAYYAAHPLYPLDKTVADLNMDSMNAWGETGDLPMLGLDYTTLDRFAEDVARLQQRELTGDPMPEKGLFYRSDHFSFAKAGVPALDLQAGVNVADEPRGWGKRKREEYIANDYHKPSDEVKPGWDLRGMALDAQAMFRIGAAVADSRSRPKWKPGADAELKATR